MKKFFRKLEGGELHFRDSWQFEMKSEFTPIRSKKQNSYTQEFFFFIPNSLRINSQTYSKEDFFQDLTNFIRYKTPEFSFEELIDPTNELSPLVRLLELEKEVANVESVKNIQEELKLLGNIVRSAVRTAVHNLLKLMNGHEEGEFEEERERLLTNLDNFRDHFDKISEKLYRWDNGIHLQHIANVDEFITNSIEYFLMGLLQWIRKEGKGKYKKSDKAICVAVIKEKSRKEELVKKQAPRKTDAPKGEYEIYRKGLLDKFVLDALLLTTNRFSADKKFKNFIGAIAAGIAMLIYLLLFIWQGEHFVLNSAPFVVITVILYIIKDRLKEGVKSLSFKQAFRWFSDYTTEIYSPYTKRVIGFIKESFSYRSEKKLPQDIVKIRNRDFHTVMETFKRPETVLHYKSRVNLKSASLNNDRRRSALNIITRFNIHAFLKKLSNPFHAYNTLDPDSYEIIRERYPKVYHLNIIMKNSFLTEEEKEEVELKKFRVILDKNGIKRIEQI